jgi:flagellar biosynthesis GTPase FlhF
MENNLDLNNADKLDSYQEEEILEYSNINWKDPFAGAKAAAQKAKAEADRIANKAKEAAKKAKAEADRIANQAKDAANRAKAEADRIAKKAKEQAEAAKKNLEQTTKDAIKSTKDQIKDAAKNIKTTAKELSDKAKQAFRKLLGKAVLGMTYTAIRSNQLGIATRLYPAIASSSEIKVSKFKPSFVPKAKLSYADVLKKWKENGGKEEKLNEAIRLGAKLRFKKNKSKLSFDANNYYNADGDELNDLSIPQSTDDVSNITVTPDETSAVIEETGDAEVTEEQKISGWKKFLAFIMNVFKRHKADEEVPYEEGSAEASAYFEDAASVADQVSRLENLDSDGNIVIDEDLPISDKDKTSDDKILGMSKGTAIGVGIGVLVLLTIGGIVLYKKYGKK